MLEKLTDVFKAAAMKYLTAVDAEPQKSNQHEIGGLVVAKMADHLGRPIDGSTLRFDATMVYLDDYSDEPLIAEDSVSWYDSRFKDPKRGPEWRLYYPTNPVTETFRESDLMLIALTQERELLMIFCPQGSQTEVQLKSLFGAVGVKASKQLKKVPIEESLITSPIRLMLARYGIELEISRDDDEELTERLIKTFDSRFPETRKFSEFARTLNPSVCAVDDPDSALLQWMQDEEHIFRLLERHIVQKHLEGGFGDSGVDVDAFISFSLSVQNRRKSRVGFAFENHIEAVLRKNGVQFERGVSTEGKRKPDFLFPGRKAYLDHDYPESGLRILGAKTTCKERWRQVLAEADRIAQKHLITLEPSVSSEQTEEMKGRQLQLVVPVQIQETYKPEQREWLMSFKEFIVDLPDGR